MRGYIRNKSVNWVHAFKRPIGPGHKVDLNELYKEYGVKYKIGEGVPFVEWLSNVKLTDKHKWEIVLEDDLPELTAEEKAKKSTTLEVETDKKVKNNPVSPIVPTKLTIQDLVELSVRKARETLPKVRDIKLLKYALREASQRAGKDSLCRELRRRINQIEAS